MGITDLLLLRWIFGGKQNRERIKTSDGMYVCGGCRGQVPGNGRICPSCSSALYTIRGRIGRRFGAVLGIFVLLGSDGVDGIGGDFLVLVGVVLLVLVVYWYLTRPILSLFSFLAITDQL